ncbi:nuclear transport factor 2 family protein [Flavobacterium sp. FlaQc-57]|uniref:nuclear transport factor 2 family protein n=1 Tax=Flavobacterium sp. FlaQc-57 TaxID=3374186 RepID=UPI0037584168
MKIDAIVNAEIELLTAIKNADVSTLDKMLHDDLLFNLPDGQVIAKEFDLENYRSGKIKIEVLEASDQIIRIIDNTAVVSVNVLLKGVYDNKTVSNSFRYLRVWKQFDESLKVIAGSCVQLV